jgi:hypothetical protein
MHHGVTGAKHWWEQKKNKDGKMVRWKKWTKAEVQMLST